MADCIFCKIVGGEAPAAVVGETERTVAFLDLFPASPGHTLIVPRTHGENLFETSPEDLRAVVEHSKRVAEALRSVLAPDGLGVYQLNGAAAGQTVFHYHMHLVPRAAGSGLGLHGRAQAPADELQALATKIAAAMPPA